MFAAGSIRGVASGAEMVQAWTSLTRLEEAGRGSPASRALEMRVLNTLVIATDGGFAFESTEHKQVLERMKWLGAQISHGAAGGTASKELVEAETTLAMAATMHSIYCEGVLSYAGPMKQADVEASFAGFSQSFAHYDAALAAAPDAALSVFLGCLSYCLPLLCYARQHALPDFSFETLCGFDRLRATIERYDFETVHPAAKAFGSKFDCFMWGAEPLYLLLFVGDVAAARAGALKALDAHKRVLGRVQDGEASADVYTLEGFVPLGLLVAYMWLMRDHALMREYMAHSISGACLRDDTIWCSFKRFWTPFGWVSEDGHRHSTEATYLLLLRAVAALLKEGPSDGVSEEARARRAALREWLPPPSELLHLAEYETVWRAHGAGLHPAVLCATLHGEQLGDWAAADEVAAGVLRIEAFNPLLRIQCHRLHGRASAALGRHAAACEAAERAAAEAAGARYVWLEMLALGDLLDWCEAGAKESVRLRLRAVAGRLEASAEELARVHLPAGCGLV